ncbi:MAG: NAD-dependent deacylase, partial [Calditrichia bacterium]|nr:NAD-dependent deacylase [Calditrichia bacterium]
MFSEKLITRMKNVYSIAILTGAGMSAESGIPTFRGKDGLWNKFDPRVLATAQAFEKKPSLVWEWYLWRRNLIKKSKPNLGHYALAELQDFYSDFYLITQNVDGLHQIAGSKRVINLHGNIFTNKCFKCGKVDENIDVIDHKNIPVCKECGGLIRPGVVWFGESLPQDEIEKAHDAAMQCEIMFVIGTSAEVEPAASLPSMAKGNGSYVVEINPAETPLSNWVDESIKESSAKVLPNIAIELEKIRKKR